MTNKHTQLCMYDPITQAFLYSLLTLPSKPDDFPWQTSPQPNSSWVSFSFTKYWLTITIVGHEKTFEKSDFLYRSQIHETKPETTLFKHVILKTKLLRHFFKEKIFSGLLWALLIFRDTKIHNISCRYRNLGIRTRIWEGCTSWCSERCYIHSLLHLYTCVHIHTCRYTRCHRYNFLLKTRFSEKYFGNTGKLITYTGIYFFRYGKSTCTSFWTVLAFSSSKHPIWSKHQLPCFIYKE